MHLTSTSVDLESFFALRAFNLAFLCRASCSAALSAIREPIGVVWEAGLAPSGRNAQAQCTCAVIAARHPMKWVGLISATQLDRKA